MDKLGIDKFAVMCWSGGGPSSYRLASKHGDRVTSLVTLAALSMHYEFGNGINRIEYSLLTGAVGNWLLKEMVKHTPKKVVGMVGSEEGDLTKEQAHALTEHIWDDDTKREFVLAVSATISGRHDGLKNDEKQFPKIGDLGLSSVATPTLLVHGTADSDVHPDQSENAVKQLPNAEILRVETGTHLCAWTDPTSDDIQAAHHRSPEELTNRGLCARHCRTSHRRLLVLGRGRRRGASRAAAREGAICVRGCIC